MVLGGSRTKSREQSAGGGVDDADVQVVDEEQDAGSGVVQRHPADRCPTWQASRAGVEGPDLVTQSTGDRQPGSQSPTGRAEHCDPQVWIPPPRAWVSCSARRWNPVAEGRPGRNADDQSPATASGGPAWSRRRPRSRRRCSCVSSAPRSRDGARYRGPAQCARSGDARGGHRAARGPARRRRSSHACGIIRTEPSDRAWGTAGVLSGLYRARTQRRPVTCGLAGARSVGQDHRS